MRGSWFISPVSLRPLLSGAEVLRFRDQAFQLYFNSPRYLEMVNRKFGADTVHEFKGMNSTDLRENTRAKQSVIDRR